MPCQNPSMRLFILSFLSLLIFTSEASYAISSTRSCAGLLGVWEQTEMEEGEMPAIFSIAADCKMTMIQADYHAGDTPLAFDSLFEEQGQLRIQYSTAPGALGSDGQPFPDPLPEELREALRGNVYQMPDGALRFGLDILDLLCGTGPDRCVSSPFVRRFD